MRFFIERLELDLPCDYVRKMKNIVENINRGYWLKVRESEVHMLLAKLEPGEAIFMATYDGNNLDIKTIHQTYRTLIFELCQALPGGGTVEELQNMADFREVTLCKFYDTFDKNWNCSMGEDKATMLKIINIEYPCDKNLLIVMEKLETLSREIAYMKSTERIHGISYEIKDVYKLLVLLSDSVRRIEKDLIRHGYKIEEGSDDENMKLFRDIRLIAAGGKLE